MASIATGGTKTLRKGVLAFRTLTLNINFLMTLAIAGAILLGQWPEAAMVTFLFGLADRLEEYSLDRARDAIGALVKLTPEKALVRTCCDCWKEVDAGTVKIGQVVRVRADERVPLDGQLLSGHSSVNQAPTTGESWPVEKTVGDQVYAGSINGQGTFDFKVTANAEGTTLARIIRAVRRAQEERSPVQRLVDRFAVKYTPAVVLLAVLTAVVPPLFWGGPLEEWIYRALVILVISCPCALVLSTPVTTMSGLAAAARLGILIKGGGVLEEGRRLRVLALDKTGTLTEGKPRITSIRALGEKTEEHALRLAASLNAHSRHPIAASFTSRCPESLLEVTGFRSLTGRGVSGNIEGSEYTLGNRRLVHERGLLDTSLEQLIAAHDERGETSVVLIEGSTGLAVFTVSDALRQSSQEAIATLHRLGIKTVILSGDNQAAVASIARQAKIDEARGELLPEEKLAAIEELIKRYGCTGMVGDGINDAPALAKASIGFAMGGSGTETAIETADVTLMNDDPRKLALFVELSRHSTNILKQNFTMAILIKVVFLGMALLGQATLWMAVMADMGGSLAVIFNGLRVLRFGRGGHTQTGLPPSGLA
jgi:Cd2+/Zn2+-exporting ATPase